MSAQALTIRGNTFAVLGRLRSMTQDEVWRRVLHLGGRVSADATLRATGRAQYVVIGQRAGGWSVVQARGAGWLAITEQDLLDALARAEAEQEAAREVVPVSDAIGELRGLFDGQPAQEVWQQLCAQLDACDPERLGALIDYAEGHLSARWPEPLDDGVAPDPARWRARAWTSRALSDAWAQAIWRGEASEAHRLCGWYDMSAPYNKRSAAVLRKLLTSAALTGLRGLDLGRQRHALPVSFVKGLWASEAAVRLRSLTLRPWLIEHAELLARPITGLPALRQIELGSPEAHAGGHFEASCAPIHEALFEAPWWSQIEGLVCSVSRPEYAISRTASVYPALAHNLERLPALRGLTLCDGPEIDALIESGAFAQITHLKLCAPPLGAGRAWPEHVIEALGQQRHSVRALDLSRAFLHDGGERVRELLQGARQRQLVEQLVASGAHEGLDTLTVAAEALAPEADAEDDARCIRRTRDALDGAGVRLVEVTRLDAWA